MVTWCTKKFNIHQLYTLPTLYLCFLYLSENKQRLVPLKHKLIGFYNRMKSVYSAVRTGSLNEVVCASSLKVNALQKRDKTKTTQKWHLTFSGDEQN
jgi:hypothetical protein